MRMAISQRRNINRGLSLGGKDEFHQKKTDLPERLSSSRRMQMQSQGEKIMEKKLSISKGEDDYYMSKRVFTNLHKVSGTENVKLNSTKPPESLTEKSGTEALRYQQNMPSYFRMMDDPKYRNIVHK